MELGFISQPITFKSLPGAARGGRLPSPGLEHAHSHRGRLGIPEFRDFRAAGGNPEGRGIGGRGERAKALIGQLETQLVELL